MGKLKQSLIDTPLEDQTDPRDPGVYPGEETAEPTEAELLCGWTMFDLNGLVSRMEQNPNAFTGEADHIRAYADRLVDVALKIEKPF